MDQMLQLAKQASEIDLEDGSKQKTFSYRDFLCMMRSSIVVQLRDLANQDERDLAELETADDAFYTPPNVSAPPPPPPLSPPSPPPLVAFGELFDFYHRPTEK
mgnify:CR=1 FL=1